MTTEAEMRVMQPQIKVCLAVSEARRREEQVLSYQALVFNPK